MPNDVAIGFVLGFALAVCLSALLSVALMRAVGKPLIKYRPTWKTGMLSCFCGYGVASVVAMVVQRYILDVTLRDFFISTAVQAAIAFPVYTLLHRLLFENGGGQKPKFNQAMVLAGLQLGLALTMIIPARFVRDSYAKPHVAQSPAKSSSAENRR
jgi:hypothetical protein